MKSDGLVRCGVLTAGVLIIAAVLFNQSSLPVHAPDEGKLGGPVVGLTADQLRKFRSTEVVFKHEFTPQEGLGPLFNGRSCFECHGQPNEVGGEGRDVTSTGVMRIGKLRPGSKYAGKPIRDFIANTTDVDVYNFSDENGPAMQRKSITAEFSNQFPLEASTEIAFIPEDCMFRSLRHAQPLFGLGLLEAVSQKTILDNMMRENDQNPSMAGRAVPHPNPLKNETDVGRFGWKCQLPNLLLFSAEAMDVELGLTTPVMLHPKSAKGVAAFSPALVHMLPKEPNDMGKLMAQFAYFQALLAPPPRGEITEQVKRGEKIFEKSECSVCHMSTLNTQPQVFLVDPDSPAPNYNMIEVAALENQRIHPYTDLLIHNMGWELADGLPQAGARGGEWRTTPLWGLRSKRFYIHDGRTTDLHQAILLHGGQGDPARQKYKALSESDKADLIAFLKSL